MTVRKTHNERFEKVRTVIAILVTSVLSLSWGCTGAEGRSPLRDEVESLRIQKAQLLKQLKQAEDKNTRLEGQLGVLSGLKSRERLECLQSLERVRIGRRTNLYDKDRDGRDEKLVVYIQPVDKQGDIIKAPGSADVQLWDLNKQPNEALIGQWHIEAPQLKKLWFATVITKSIVL